MVFNMAAAVGCSSMERKVMGENSATKLALSCKRNGLNHGCYCEDKMETRNSCKSHFFEKLLRINGSSKSNNNNCFQRPSVPTRRSRRERHSSAPEPVKRRRRSSRHDPGDTKTGEPPDELMNGQTPPILHGQTASIFHGHTATISHDHTATISHGQTEPINGQTTLLNGQMAPLTPETPESLEVATINNCLAKHKITTSVPLPKDIKDLFPLVSRSNGHTPVTPDTSRSCTPISLGPSGPSPIFNPFGSSIFNKGETTPSKETAAAAPIHCQWNKCETELRSGEIMDHIRLCHVNPQRKNEKVVCLWEGCKVYNKSSCSKSWLDRHILTHSGDKPFRCIVDGCGARFTTQGGLERHVNSHFNAQEQSPNQKHSKHGREDTPTKLLKRKRVKQIRGIQGVKTEDFIDNNLMEKLQGQLNTIADRTQLDLNGSNTSVTFHSTVIARRREESGKDKYLLHWTPEDIIPDQWVLASQVSYLQTRSIPIKCLPHDSVTTLHPSLYHQHRYRKHRRK